jgi:hypothetical protein
MIPASATLPEIGIGGKRTHKKESEVSEDL